MTLRQQLLSAVKKALKNGYEPMPGYIVKKTTVQVNKGGHGIVAYLLEKPMAAGENKQYEITFSVADVLFDHGFGRAYWGDDFLQRLNDTAALEANWERIHYLGRV